MYKANLDKELLKDWCAYCEGKNDFDKFHFSTLLMEAFLERYTPELDGFIKEITKYFDSSLYKNIVRTFSDEPADKGEIQHWVDNDLKEKRKIITNIDDASSLIQLIDNQKYVVVHDRQKLYKAMESENHSILYDAVGDYVIDHSWNDKRKYALQEILYNIASDNNLVYGLISGMMEGDVDFSNYLEIYRRGCDYAVGDDHIVLFVYKPS